jgi:prepilin-type N-terminal cleavage/methylation domain-containing protein
MGHHRGFSLIEATIVVAVIGLLALVGMSGYQIYLMRARVNEALVQVAALKTAVQTQWLAGGRAPVETEGYFTDTTPEFAALAAPALRTQFVSRAFVERNGTLKVGVILQSVSPVWDGLHLYVSFPIDGEGQSFTCAWMKDGVINPPSFAKYLPPAWRTSCEPP